MKSTAYLLMLELGLVAAGCGHSIEYRPLNKPPHEMQHRPPESVEIIMAERTNRAVVEVGVFETEQNSPAAGTPEMVAKLRERAAAVGCDALLISDPHDGDQSVRSHRAICLMFSDPL